MLCGWLQLTENARKWGKERSELLVRLQEAEHGLRGSPLTMTSYPRIVSLQQLLDMLLPSTVVLIKAVEK